VPKIRFFSPRNRRKKEKKLKKGTRMLSINVKLNKEVSQHVHVKDTHLLSASHHVKLSICK
jgi:hypothetical protein